MSEANKSNREPRMPKVWESCITLAALIGVLAIGIVIFGAAVHVPMFVGVCVAALMALYLGHKWDSIEKMMMDGIYKALQSICILIIVGILIGVWINAGVVPTMIYYGLKIMHPAIFFIAAVLICSITSLATGTSWGTMGTMGVALMGIGFGLDMNPAMTAGAILSGAYFGDKMSPLSDTTNLAPASAGTTLYKHIGAMWKTTLPAYLITFGCFTVLGFFYQGGQVDHATIDLFIDTIGANFRITPLLLLPMVVLLVLNMRKFPAIPGMAIGSLLAVILAVAVQGFPVGQVVAGLNYGYVTPTGVDLVDQLLLRGGIQNMMYTFSLSCIAISFGGVMEHVGYLKKIVAVVISRVKYDFLMVPVVILSTTLGTLTMGEVYLSIVVNGSLYRQAFQERKLRPEMLSRLLEEGGTLTQVFIPWSTSGVFIAATLGVSTAEYWKFAFLNYINPLLSIVLCLFGYGVLRVGQAGWRDKRGGTHHTSTEESEKC